MAGGGCGLGEGCGVGGECRVGVGCGVGGRWRGHTLVAAGLAIITRCHHA